MPTAIRDTTWGKIFIGGIVWFVAFNLMIFCFKYTYLEMPTKEIGVLSSIAGTIFPTILTQFAVDRKFNWMAAVAGSVVWSFSLYIAVVIVESDFDGPFQTVGDPLSKNRHFEVILFTMDITSLAGMAGAAVYFGGRAVLKDLRGKDD